MASQKKLSLINLGPLEPFVLGELAIIRAIFLKGDQRDVLRDVLYDYDALCFFASNLNEIGGVLPGGAEERT